MNFNISAFIINMPTANRQFYIRFFGDMINVGNQGFQSFLNLRNEGDADENIILRKQHFDLFADKIKNPNEHKK